MTPTRFPSLPTTSTTRLLTKLTQVAACLFLTVGLVGGLAAASAQTSPADSPNSSATSAESASPQWQATFDEHVAHELRQRPSRRASHLQVVTNVASSQEISSEKIRLPETSEALLYVVENDANERHRMMAVQALHAIGPEHVGKKQYEKAMSRLYTLAEKESSEAVRDAVADVINRFQSS